MKAPCDWIRELVPEYRGSPEKTAEALTFSGTEVEGIETAGTAAVLLCAVTSNRVDCLGMVGIAREVAAVRKKPLVLPDASVAFTEPRTSARLRVEVRARDFCPRYCAFVIEGLTVGPSPPWLAARLEAMGVRPINNVVDVTNYVLFELNQPLHAFDLDRLHGPAIVVRRAEEGETITALNEREYRLEPWMGVIADARRPVAVAGVMGGLDTAVTASTKRIVIESAYFDPPSIRRASRALALASDSSHRFERGIDLAGAHRAACRAARLILETGGGELRADPIDLNENAADPGPPKIPLRTKRVREVTGVSVPARRAEEILVALGCDVAGREDGVLDVRPPSFRADLVREIDLVEEVIRVVGLDRVPEGTGLLVRPVARDPRSCLAEVVRDLLARAGFLECITPIFVPEGPAAGVAFLDHGDALRVRNPVRAGEGVIRRSLLPSLLQVRQHNQDQGSGPLRLFETSAVAFDQDADLPRQLRAAGLLADVDFRSLKGVVEALLDALGVPFDLGPSTFPHFGREQLAIGSGVVPVGVLGVVAPALAELYRLKSPPRYCELDLTALTPLWRPVKSFTGLPRYPAVRRDLAFVLDAARTYGDLVAALRAPAVAELESIEFFDEYRGAQVGAGRKSLALSLAFRSPDRTLQSADVDALVHRLVASAAERCGATLRA
jgi:phenylalanyl-tRNA synthetase beta chain